MAIAPFFSVQNGQLLFQKQFLNANNRGKGVRYH